MKNNITKKLKKLMAVALCATMVCALLPTNCFGSVEVSASQVYASEWVKVNNTGKTYYVDADKGDDSNSGLSEAAAWKTLDKVNATTFGAGDAVLLKRGCTWTDTFLYPKGSGNASNRNYISCYGDASLPKPVIVSSYKDTAPNLPPSNTSIYLGNNQNYWTIENLDVTATNDAATSLINIVNTSMYGIEIKNCTLTGADMDNWSGPTKSSISGINVSGYIHGLLIEDNEIYNVKDCGINIDGSIAGCDYNGNVNSASGKDVVVRGNYLDNIGTNGILVNNCYEPLVEYNVVSKSHSYAKDKACGGIWPFACYGALFQYNEAYNTRTIYDGEGMDCDYNCYYTTFQYNYSHDNVGGFMLICVEPNAIWMPGGYSYNVGSTVRYNISQNDMHYVFTLTGGIQKTRIYNNTIYNDRNTKDNDSQMPLTAVFFEYSKGTNTLNGLDYADDLLIANNIFYLDTALSSAPKRSTNVVYKNNLHTGLMYNNGIENGVTTYVLDSSNNKTDKVCCKESRGNINGGKAGFVSGGTATNGRETCAGYQLYQDSEAIGAGIAIEDGYHSCPNDFFGNKLDASSINIGAYGGKGVKRTASIIFDGKYETMLDFERNEVGASGVGEKTKVNSGVDRCIAAKGTATVVETSAVQNKVTSSTKSLMLKNESDEKQDVYTTYYVYPREMENANGIRVYMNTQGRIIDVAVKFKVSTDEGTKYYTKNVQAKSSGWYYFTFDELYGGQQVTPELMRGTSELTITASLPSKQYMYIDDIQVNKGEMDPEMKTTFVYEDVEGLVELTNFSNYNVNDQKTYGYKASGPAIEAPRLATYNNRKALSFTSSSSYSTGVSFGYSLGESINKIKSALTDNSNAYEGLQLNMQMIGYVSDGNGGQRELNEQEKAVVKDSWNVCNYTVASNVSLTYTTVGGQTKSVNNLIIHDVKIDDNNQVRIPFDKLYTTYTENGKSYTVHLSDFDSAQRTAWINGIQSILLSYSTCGGKLGKELTTKNYLYSISAYKGVKHTESSWIVMKEAACDTTGYSEKVCVECGQLLGTKTIASKGHKWQEYYVAPTCTKTGVRIITCEVCGFEKSNEELAELKHAMSRVVTKKATCTDDGEGYDICSRCNTMLHEYVVFAKIGHSLATKATKKATPTANGSTGDTYCTRCNKVTKKGAVIYRPNAIVGIKTSYVYNGKVYTPAVTVKDIKGNVINKANYTVTYKNNKLPGTATITVKFKGTRYSGSLTKTFKIILPTTSITAVKRLATNKYKITWTKKSYISGYVIKYMVGNKYVTKRVAGSKNVALTITGLIKSKISTIRIRTYVTINKKNYYSAWHK